MEEVRRRKPAALMVTQTALQCYSVAGSPQQGVPNAPQTP